MISVCVETLEEALAKHAKPEIFNIDQGSQSRAPLFTGLLIKNGIAISMDGNLANVFVERLWRSMKYEDISQGLRQRRRGPTSIGRYLDFYNGRRPHSRHVWPGHHFDGRSARRPGPELKPVTQGLPQRASLTYSPRVVTTGEKRGVSAMSQSAFETSEQVLKFDPKAKGRSDVTPLDDAGQAIVAQIRTAADLAKGDCDRAMSFAHKLSMELRAAEDRTQQMAREVEHWQERAARAEQWLQTIQREIEEKLLTRRSAHGDKESAIR